MTAAGTASPKVRIEYHDGLEYGPAEWRVSVGGMVFSAPTLEGIADTVATLVDGCRRCVASAQADLDRVSSFGRVAVEVATLRAAVDARAAVKRDLAAAREALRRAEAAAEAAGVCD